jgi:hypothetical protein
MIIVCAPYYCIGSKKSEQYGSIKKSQVSHSMDMLKNSSLIMDILIFFIISGHVD